MTSVEDLWCTHYAWIICTVYTCSVEPGEFWLIRFDQAQFWFLLVLSSTPLIAACWPQPFCLAEWAMVKTQHMVKLRYAKLNKKNSIHPFVKRASPSLNLYRKCLFGCGITTTPIPCVSDLSHLYSPIPTISYQEGRGWVVRCNYCPVDTLIICLLCASYCMSYGSGHHGAGARTVSVGDRLFLQHQLYYNCICLVFCPMVQAGSTLEQGGRTFKAQI